MARENQIYNLISNFFKYLIIGIKIIEIFAENDLGKENGNYGYTVLYYKL